MILFDPEKEEFPQRCVVFVSGRGSNFQALKENLNPSLARIVGVFSSDQDQPAVRLATEARLPVAWPGVGFHKKSLDERDEEILRTVEKWNPHWILLAGYRRLVGARLIKTYANRVLNIHPSLLPSFPGMKAQEEMLTFGVRVAGATVHFVDELTDNGPIAGQASVAISDQDTLQTLQQKVLPLEHKLYSATVNDILQKGCRLNGRRVEFLQ